jgi:uncharacterized tellurite resistance protein B-like protein
MPMQLSRTDFATMDDAQRTAVLEAMIVALIADDKITPGELRRFDELVKSLPWGVDEPVLSAMIRAAKDRALAPQSRSEIHDYVSGLAARLPSPSLRQKVVFTMATLMSADGEVAQVERNVLGLFVVAFNITTDRMAAIKAALTDEPPPPTPRSDLN